MSPDDTLESPVSADPAPDLLGALALLATARPEIVPCPGCGAEAWNEAAARGGAVTQCPRCSYRVAYGEVMPRIVIAPDGPLLSLNLSEHAVPGSHTYRVDGELAAMLILNLASLLPEAMLKATVKRLVAHL